MKNLKNLPFVLALLVAFWPILVQGAERPTAQALVKLADNFRQPFGGTDLKIRLKSYRDGELHDETNYQVWASGNEKSLVAMLDPKVRGQKVLMVPEGMWLHMPSSRRAIRITPMQRLMGQASYGDITQLRFGGLYKAEFDSQNPEGTIDGVAVWHLILTATHVNATYTRIALSVTKDAGRPLFAKYYLQSGKLLKKATYGAVQDVSGKPFINKITFADSIRANRKTVMSIHAIKEKDFAALKFSVQTLARWKP